MITIYGLCDPQTNVVRYVGKTSHPVKQRLREHLRPSALRVPSHKNYWLRSLLAKGLVPDIKILAHPPIENWKEAEVFWISQFSNLTNLTEGGDGHEIVFTPEHRALIAAANRKRVVSKATREKMASARRGYIMPLECRTRIAESRRGIKFSAKHCLALSKAARRPRTRYIKVSPVTKAQIIGMRHNGLTLSSIAAQTGATLSNVARIVRNG